MLRVDRRVDVVHCEVMVRLERLVVGHPSEGGLWVVWAGRERVAEVEDVLIEERHLDVRMSVVEVDSALQRTARNWDADARGEVGLHVVAEVKTEDEELAGPSRKVIAERVEINERRASV